MRIFLALIYLTKAHEDILAINMQFILCCKRYENNKMTQNTFIFPLYLLRFSLLSLYLPGYNKLELETK